MHFHRDIIGTWYLTIVVGLNGLGKFCFSEAEARMFLSEADTDVVVVTGNAAGKLLRGHFRIRLTVEES